MAEENPGGNADIQALMQTVQGLTATVQLLLQQQQQNPPQQQPAAAAHVPITDFYHTDLPFDLSRSSAAYAYTEACKGLPEESKWRGDPSEVAPWITHLRNLCSTRGLDRPATSVVSIAIPAVPAIGNQPAQPATFKDLFSLSVTIAEANAAKLARDAAGDARAIQNSRILFEIIKSSIGEPLYSSIFREVIPEDGPLLFVMVTRRSSVTALSTAMNAEEELKNLDPHEYKYEIIAINTRITQLFDQAAIVMPLTDAKKRICILTIYNRIKEPSEWHQWVSRMTENIEDSTPTNVIAPDMLMAKAETKVSNLLQMVGSPWKNASTTSQWQQVVALVNKKTNLHPKGKPRSDKEETPKDTENTNPNAEQKFPPFVTHWKDNETGKLYEKGDTKTWNGETWYYCPCKHRPVKNRWHRHKPDECRVLKAFEAKQKADKEKEEPPKTPRSYLSAMLSSTSDPDEQEKLANALAQFE